MDFIELKKKKERGVTNEKFMDKTKDYFKKADCIVVVGMSQEGVIETFYTHSTSLNAIGMMEIAKTQMINEMEG